MTNPYAPPVAAVADIGLTGSNEPASRFSRLAAVLLDGVVGFLLVYVPAFIAAAMFVGLSGGPDPEDPTAVITFVLFACPGFIALLVWNVILLRRNGQTVGKKWMGIKIVRLDGSPATLGRTIGLRMLVNGLLGVIPLYGIVDILFIFSESRRCLHDRLADTMVVVA